MRRSLRVGAVLLLYLSILGLGHLAGEFFDLSLVAEPVDDARPLSLYLGLSLGLGLYMVLMALPFVPGMEVSVAILITFGPEIAPALYMATVTALTGAYAVGNRIHSELIGRFFGALGFTKAERFVGDLAPLTPDGKLQALIDRAPIRLVPFLLRHRYIAVMVALNLPGNTIIGGGGGIALLAGMSGIFRFRYYLAAVALAVTPVPVAVIVFGH